MFESLIANLAGYPGLLAALPSYSDSASYAAAVNQNQGGSVYPFAAPCPFAGLVTDIQLITSIPFKPPVMVTSIERAAGCKPDTDWACMDYAAWLTADYAAFETAVRAVPRLRFADAAGNTLDTALLTCETVSPDFYYFHDDTGRNTVRYHENRLADLVTRPLIYPSGQTEPVALVARCYSRCSQPITLTQQQFREDAIELNVDYGLAATVEGNTIKIITSRLPVTSQDDNVLKTINGLQPSHGNIDLKGDGGCFNVTGTIDAIVGTEFNILGLASHALAVRNDCAECCSFYGQSNTRRCSGSKGTLQCKGLQHRRCEGVSDIRQKSNKST
ncbi:MAG: hypothetical protein LBU65_17730 [Planctomycetaceae bacterium]|jgi:hypothetical protein|nr:hypothetical protein [Planctomycetaceae bacterium]